MKTEVLSSALKGYSPNKLIPILFVFENCNMIKLCT